MPLENILRAQTRELERSIDRALDLYSRLIELGFTQSDNKHRKLTTPDQRDIAQFLFFEVASTWEQYCQECFVLAARDHFQCGRERAEKISGNIDRGLDRIGGWSNPKILANRAKALFGGNHCMARLDSATFKTHSKRLTWAIAVRDKIAHSKGQKSKQAFRDLLTPMRVPKLGRQGISPGRLLLDYPIGVKPTNRWFHRFMRSYRRISTYFRKTLL